VKEHCPARQGLEHPNSFSTRSFQRLQLTDQRQKVRRQKEKSKRELTWESGVVRASDLSRYQIAVKKDPPGPSTDASAIQPAATKAAMAEANVAN